MSILCDCDELLTLGVKEFRAALANENIKLKAALANERCKLYELKKRNKGLRARLVARNNATIKEQQDTIKNYRQILDGRNEEIIRLREGLS